MTKDPFGFTKAINFDKLNNPKVLKELEKIFIKDAALKERKEFVKKIKEEKMKCRCCNKKIKNQEFYLSDKGIIVCFICYIKTSKID